MKIENEHLAVEIASKGAELQSIVRKLDQREMLWQGDRAIWARRAPILFPIVGRLKNDTYFIDQDSYTMTQHGFARDMDFEVAKWSPEELVFRLRSSPETCASYPFDFTFYVGYKLEGSTLIQTMKVLNDGSQDLPVSFGLHPAFSVEQIAKCRLETQPKNTWESDTVENGVRTGEQREAIIDGQLRLDEQSFVRDAFIIDSSAMSQLQLIEGEEPLVTMRFSGFPYLGVWAKPGAPYVCLEPWCGIADKLEHNQQIFQKEGVTVLFPNQEMTRAVEMAF